jgi:hypothetical protein
MARFYDHPKTGVLHLALPAGGSGGGGTGEFDQIATDKLKEEYPREFARYMENKKAVAEQIPAATAEPIDEPLAEVQEDAPIPYVKSATWPVPETEVTEVQPDQTVPT